MFAVFVLGTLVIMGFVDFVTWLGEYEQPVLSLLKTAVK
jgi:hypothetical protein